MKKTLSIALVCATTFLFASEMPPMPPGMMGGAATPPQSSAPAAPKSQSQQMGLPGECDAIPPMIVLFPPPMQVEVDKCRNALYLPKQEVAAQELKRLVGKEVRIESITVAEGFKELYRIVATWEKKTHTLLCNSPVSHCLHNPELLTKKVK